MKKSKFLKLKKEIQSVMGEGFICEGFVGVDGISDRLGSVDEFHGREETYCGFWCTGEGGFKFKATGLKGCNYYAFDIPDERDHYSKDGSILNEFYDWLSERGLYAEWYDCGTVMIYEG